MSPLDRISLRLKLKDLHTLRTIAAAGSMAKAARQLALSQPAISKAIAEMEHTLGVPLLERSSRGVHLTEFGAILCARGRVIFDELGEALGEIAHHADPSTGEVRIGTTEPMAEIIASIVSRLSGQYPRIRYQVTMNDTGSLMRDLRARAFDVAITRWITAPDQNDLSIDPLFNAALAVMADRGHPLMRKRTLRLTDVMEEAWCLSPPDTFLGRLVGAAFHAEGLALPPTTLTTVSIYMRLCLLAEGRFLTMLPRTMLLHPAVNTWLRALPVSLAGTVGEIAAITLKGRRINAATRLFIAAGHEVAADITRRL